MTVRRPYEADPEPVMVTIGDEDWVRRARLADVVLGTSPDVECACGTCAEMFECYPGLSLVALSLPDDVIVVGSRVGNPLVVRARPQTNGVPGTVATVAAAIYFWAADGSTLSR